MLFVANPFQDCEEFDKKVEKLQGEKERRMEECLDELRGLEDGYRQKHRDAKQVTNWATEIEKCRGSSTPIRRHMYTEPVVCTR